MATAPICMLSLYRMVGIGGRHIAVKIFVLLVLLAALIFAGGNRAWADQPSTAHINAVLQTETTAPRPGSTITIAIVMTPQPGWHGYWENPGDAGKPMEMRWQLPAGTKMSALRYPVPDTLMIAGIMNHVYNAPYAVLVDVVIPATAKVGEALAITAHGDWLACTEQICVPESGELSLLLRAGDGRIDPEMRRQFDKWRTALPQPLGTHAIFEQRDETLRIGIPFPLNASIEKPWFFRLTEGAKSYAAPQAFSRNGNLIIVELKNAAGSRLPSALSGILKIGERRGLNIIAVPGKVPVSGPAIGVKAKPASHRYLDIIWALLGALLGGLLLNVMPCVFPILSLKAISLASAGGDARRAKAEAWSYAFGVTATCMALGATLLLLRAGGQQIGWAFQLQNPAVILLLAMVAFALTLNLAGLFVLQSISVGNELAQSGGRMGAFWTGALVAFVATPCTGPFMAAALGAALILPWFLALAIFAGLGIGIASPFLAIAYLPAVRARIPRPGRWMIVLQRWLAVPMGITTLALLWLIWRQGGQNALGVGLSLLAVSGAACVLYGRAQARAKAPLGRTGLIVLALNLAIWAGGATVIPHRQTALAANDGTIAFSEEALATARASGKPVFLYFTADWCLSCKVNEAAAIERQEVHAAFDKADVIVMVGDWTNGDPAISRFLEKQGRSGVPLYMWFSPADAQPHVLPQILTPSILVDFAETRA